MSTNFFTPSPYLDPTQYRRPNPYAGGDLGGESPFTDESIAKDRPDPTPNYNNIPGYTDYTPELRNYLQTLRDYPRREAYRPSLARSLGSALVGLGYGPQAQQSFLDQPYSRAMESYGRRAQLAQAGFELPMEMQSQHLQAMMNYQRMLQEQATAERARAAAEYDRFRMSPEAQTKYGSLGYGRGTFNIHTGETQLLPQPSKPDVIRGADGGIYDATQGTWLVQPHPYETPAQKEARINRNWQYKVNHPMPSRAGTAGKKGPTPAAIKTAQLQAMTNVIGLEKYKDLRQRDKSGKYIFPSEPDPSWFSKTFTPGSVSTDEQRYRDYWNDVQKQMESILPGSPDIRPQKLQEAEPLQDTGGVNKVGKYTLSPSDEDEDENGE